MDTPWIRQFGAKGADGSSSVAVDGDGNVYVSGEVAGALPGQTSLGGNSDDVRGYDAYLRKYDVAGTELWTRQFGSDDTDVASAVAVDGAGNVFVGGIVGGALPGQTSAGAWDAFVRKYDSAGAELWTRQFGSSGTDGGSVAVDGVGNVYVSGFTANGLPGQPTVDAGADAGTGADAGVVLWTYVFIRKYDTAGNELWTRQFGANGGHVFGYAAVDAAGNVYVSGLTDAALLGQTSAGGQDAFVRKYDASGAHLWTRQFGSTATDSARSVTVDDHGNVYLAGFSNGALPGQTSAGATDAFVRKYDGSGTEVWTRQFGTSEYDEATSIKARAGILYIGGETRGTLPGQTGAGATDVFLRQYDDTGAELGTRQFGTTSVEENLSVSVGRDGTVYAAGLTDGAFPGQINDSPGVADAFVTRFPR